MPKPKKTTHSVFNVPQENLLQLLDEAWSRKELGKEIEQRGGRFAYDIPMDRVIGTNGERTIRIVTEGRGTGEVVTSFPKR